MTLTRADALCSGRARKKKTLDPSIKKATAAIAVCGRMAWPPAHEISLPSAPLHEPPFPVSSVKGGESAIAGSNSGFEDLGGLGPTAGRYKPNRK